MHSAKLIWVTPDAEALIGKIARVSNPKNNYLPQAIDKQVAISLLVGYT